jgi:hypothetical protein
MPLGYPVPRFAPADADPCFCGNALKFAECCGSRAANRKLPAGVLVVHNFVDPELCAKWLARLEKQPRQRARMLDYAQSRPGAPVYVEDPARVCDDVTPGVLRKAINDKIADGFRLAVQTTTRELAWFETPRILRYQPGGKYLHHADSCQFDVATRTWYRVEDRDLSLLIYLNEDFTGGGLTFVNFHCHFRPRAGDLLVFPSDNRYEHQAEIVQSGVRYAIASWAAYSDTRRVRPRPPGGAIPFQSARRG